MFCQRFQEALYERLQSVHQQQQQQQQDQQQKQQQQQEQHFSGTATSDSNITVAPSLLTHTFSSLASNASKSPINQDTSTDSNAFDHWIR